jgi:hypothetical protein
MRCFFKACSQYQSCKKEHGYPIKVNLYYTIIQLTFPMNPIPPLIKFLLFCIQEVLISLSILAVVGLLDPVYSLQRYMKSIYTKEQTIFRLIAMRFRYNVDDWSKSNMIALGVWKFYFEIQVYTAFAFVSFLICFKLNEIGNGFGTFLKEKLGPTFELVQANFILKLNIISIEQAVKVLYEPDPSSAFKDQGILQIN